MSAVPELDAPATVRPKQSIWSWLRESIAGSTQDFTTMPIARAVPMLAIPMVLEMAMESVFAVVDIFWVSRLGAAAVATVGLTEAMMTIIYSVAMGLGMAGTAVIARRVGEKNPDGASVAAVQAAGLAFVLAVLMGCAAFAAPQLLSLMGADDQVLATGVNYTRWMLAGNVSVTMLFVLNAVFRGAGDPSIAMRSLWLASGANIVLVPLLVWGPGPLPALGVTGAGIATTLGRGIGAVYVAWLLFGGTRRIAVAARHMKLDVPVLANMVGMAWSASLQMLIMSASWIGVIRILAAYGSDVLAGFTISMRAVVFAMLPAWGMGSAAATLVGQNLGAGHPERAERSVWVSGHYATAWMAVAGVLFLVFAPGIVSVFSSDPNVMPYAVANLRVLAIGFLFFGYGFVVSQAFNGAGDTRTPIWLNLGAFWAFQIPLAWLLAKPLNMGPTGVFIAGSAAFAVFASVSMWVFSRGKWKLKRV